MGHNVFCTRVTCSGHCDKKPRLYYGFFRQGCVEFGENPGICDIADRPESPPAPLGSDVKGVGVERTLYSPGRPAQKILGCPYCGCDYTARLHTNLDYVVCDACGAQGHVFDGHPEDAVAEWNRVSRIVSENDNPYELRVPAPTASPHLGKPVADG